MYYRCTFYTLISVLSEIYFLWSELNLLLPSITDISPFWWQQGISKPYFKQKICQVNIPFTRSFLQRNNFTNKNDSAITVIHKDAANSMKDTDNALTLHILCLCFSTEILPFMCPCTKAWRAELRAPSSQLNTQALEKQDQHSHYHKEWW